MRRSPSRQAPTVDDEPAEEPSSSPPVGWALNQKYPPGYGAQRWWDSGRALWVVYLVLMVVGLGLSVLGSWVKYQAQSLPSPGTNPLAQFQAGQAVSTAGFVVLSIALVFGLISIAIRLGRRRSERTGTTV
jgi:hypothetical protein